MASSKLYNEDEIIKHEQALQNRMPNCDICWEETIAQEQHFRRAQSHVERISRDLQILLGLERNQEKKEKIQNDIDKNNTLYEQNKEACPKWHACQKHCKDCDEKKEDDLKINQITIETIKWQIKQLRSMKDKYFQQRKIIYYLRMWEDINKKTKYLYTLKKGYKEKSTCFRHTNIFSKSTIMSATYYE